MKISEKDQIEAIRRSSRTVVRELGFMRSDLANSKLSASAVHCLIEIGNGAVSSAREVAALLKLEKSSVSRLLKGLEQKGLLESEVSPKDARLLTLALTENGRLKRDEIERYARANLQRTLALQSTQTVELISKGLDAYAKALLAEGVCADKLGAPQEVSLRMGYQASLLGRVVSMHGAYYAKYYNFGSVFECKVASEMAEFIARADKPQNLVISAMVQREIVGSVSIDGEDLGRNRAHLRWFIVDDSARGLGAGHAMLAKAMDFVDQNGFKETVLWTFKGLEAARHLYEKMGFELVEEKLGDQWGKKVHEQCFVRRPPAL